MANFIFYDVAFLIIFGIIATLFFYKHKKNVKRQGWIFLYHTKVGIKFIEWTAKKFNKILKPLSVLVIGTGYLLMGTILWVITKSVYIYVTTPIPKQLQNLPPIAPLIPYFPRIFNLESLFPPLYFTYFIIALGIIAISHEFSHGIFARLWKIKVKTTGLAFFGPFFGAFVEPDEKKMLKSKKYHQLSILAAGTFANIVMTILFSLIMWAFFVTSFAPAGITFNAYAQTTINVTDITGIDGQQITTLEDLEMNSVEGLNEITVNERTYLASQESLKTEVLERTERIIVFENAPAVKAELQGAIAKIDDKNIQSREDLTSTLQNLKPNDEITITTIQEGEERIITTLNLGEKDGKAFLGIGFYDLRKNTGISGKLQSLFAKIKDPRVYYEPSWDGDFVIFIYDLLWWIIVLNILVALMNMLPVSILDGGRFFYLTIWGITKSEKVGRKAYQIITWFILLLIAAMMGKWLINLVL